MSRMKAIVITGIGKFELKNDAPIPEPKADEVCVRVIVAGQNPLDVMMERSPNAKIGSFAGCDFSGTIDKLGAEVTNRKLGDRVAGLILGFMTPSHGAFAEYLVTRSSTLFSIPETTSFEEAAGIGAGAYTASQVLWQSLSLSHTPSNPLPEKTPFLVWSAASTVGHYVTMLAYLSGYAVIAVAAAIHHDRLKECCAAAVFDYKDPDVSEKIKEYTQGALTLAADCRSDIGSARAVSECFGDQGGKVAIVRRVDSPRTDVHFIFSTGPTLFGPFLGNDHSADAPVYAQRVSELLMANKIPLLKATVIPKGLAGIQEGLELHRTDKVSGEKIVYRISDTPDA